MGLGRSVCWHPQARGPSDLRAVAPPGLPLSPPGGCSPFWEQGSSSLYPGKQQVLELELAQPFEFCRGESSLEMKNTKCFDHDKETHTVRLTHCEAERVSQRCTVHHLSWVRPLPSPLSDHYVILLSVTFGVLNIFSVYIWPCCQMLYFIHHGPHRPTTKYWSLWRSFCRRELGLF